MAGEGKDGILYVPNANPWITQDVHTMSIVNCWQLLSLTVFRRGLFTSAGVIFFLCVFVYKAKGKGPYKTDEIAVC